MTLLSSYSHLPAAFKSGEECLVKGIDWATRFIRPYRCRVVRAPACVARRMCTLTYSSIVLPHHKLLANPLPYPFSSVPLKSLLRLRPDEFMAMHPIAVAPIADVANHPFYPNQGVVADMVITFSAITRLTPFNTVDVYDIELLEGDSYILNNTVRVV